MHACAMKEKRSLKVEKDRKTEKEKDLWVNDRRQKSCMQEQQARHRLPASMGDLHRLPAGIGG